MSDKRYDYVPDDAHDPAQDVPIPDSLSDGLACCDPGEWAESANSKELIWVIETLRQPGHADELRGEAAALAAFRAASRRSASARPPLRLRVTHASRRAKVVAALLVGSVGVGTATAAAIQGELPAPLQQAAHVLFGAPTPNSDDDSSGADHDERPADAQELSSHTVAEQAPYDSVLDFSTSDAAAALAVPGVTSEDSAGADLDRSSAGSTGTSVPPPDAVEAGGPPPGSGQSDGPAPKAEAPPGTPTQATQPTNAGKPTTPGPPVGAGQPQGSGRPESVGRPESAGAPADPGPPPNTRQPDAGTRSAPAPEPAGGLSSGQGGPPADPSSGRQPPPAKP